MAFIPVNPSIYQTVKEEGKIAFYRNQTIDANPYSDKNPLAMWWAFGWNLSEKEFNLYKQNNINKVKRLSKRKRIFK